MQMQVDRRGVQPKRWETKSLVTAPKFRLSLDKHECKYLHVDLALNLKCKKAGFKIVNFWVWVDTFWVILAELPAPVLVPVLFLKK